ncbi:MAG: 4Fe-4S dicluster domain-containing protein [bacterium]|nr:4Fe-4S dicluster domain-containing protein [bacterium]
MSIIQINSETCNGCGTCVAVCPPEALEMKNGCPIVTGGERCIVCGHCAAICPTGSVSSHPDNSLFSVIPIPDNTPPEQKVLLLKRSVRKFKTEKPGDELLKSLIYYGEKAPSSHNFRKREYIVVTDLEKIKEMEQRVAKVYKSLLGFLKPPVLKILSWFSKPTASVMEEFIADFKHLVNKASTGDSPVFRAAPCVVCIIGPKNYDQSKDDCVAAQHYMMLYGHTRGLGSCIIGYAHYAHKPLEKYLGIPKDKRIYAVSIFGYPKYNYKKEIRYPEPPITWK